MSQLRNRLESYVVRNTGELVHELDGERRTELADALTELEGHGKRAADAEARATELVEKLENRNVVIAKSRARIEELEDQLAALSEEAGDREERITEQLETERIRVAERELTFRSAMDERELELARRHESLQSREEAIHASDRDLADRERMLAMRENSLTNKIRELESQTDERLRARELEIARREAATANAEQELANEQQVFERRKVQAVELERRAEHYIQAIKEREAKISADAEELTTQSFALAERERQLELRKQELEDYVGRVQRTYPSQH